MKISAPRSPGRPAPVEAPRAREHQETGTTFGVLGPLEVRAADGTPAFIGQRKKRQLLALLLLHAGAWVSPEEISAALWEDEPPRSALGNIKTYVSELRRALPPAVDPDEVPPGTRPGAGAPRPPHDPFGAAGTVAALSVDRIVSRSGEYGIRVRPDELDVALFDDGALAGRAALLGGSPAEAAALLQRTLRLWRGQPYEELPGDVAVAETARLEEQRWVVHEALIDARLALGQHDCVLPALRALTIEHPTRERLWIQLLAALDQAGRRAEALHAYQLVYRTLTDRLGIEPGTRLQLLHQRILTGDRDPDEARYSRPGTAGLDGPESSGSAPARTGPTGGGRTGTDRTGAGSAAAEPAEASGPGLLSDPDRPLQPGRSTDSARYGRGPTGVPPG
jgi:DNA-binding SARP family transcriptional activator